MTDRYKYKSISLKNSTYQRLTNLTKELIPGVNLSGAKAVEVIIDKVSSFEGITGTADAKETKKIQ
jgi:hypothetical protein